MPTKFEIYSYIARIIVILLSLPVHEFAHAFAAAKLGDNTPERYGRLTLNPFAHLDPVGSLMLIVFSFGWAKPVPVNTNNFKKPRRDMALVAIAGPISNILMALMGIIALKLIYRYPLMMAMSMGNFIYLIVIYIIFINIMLAIFNFLPIPPLDGSNVFSLLIPSKAYYNFQRKMSKYFPVFIVLLLVLNYKGILGGIMDAMTWRVFDFLDAVTAFLGRIG